MKLALCNEVLSDFALSRQCELAAALGYQGLELAPYTLDSMPHRLSSEQRRDIRRTVEATGLVVSGLHWLLEVPEGLSITSTDEAVRDKTIRFMRDLVALCADLGGAVLVHGSPKQRRLPEDPAGSAAARGWAIEAFAAAGEAARDHGVTYCIEALAPPHADFINTVAEAAAIVDAIANPSLRTMIDFGAARANPDEAPVEELIDQWLPSGHVAHIQLRDSSRRGPGQGEDLFREPLDALDRHSYQGWMAVEPIEIKPNGLATAAYCAGYVKALRQP